VTNNSYSNSVPSDFKFVKQMSMTLNHINNLETCQEDLDFHYVTS